MCSFTPSDMSPSIAPCSQQADIMLLCTQPHFFLLRLASRAVLNIDRAFVSLSDENRRRTNVQQLTVQNRFVHFFLLSFILFYYPWAKTPCFEGKSPGGKIMKKCQKVWKSAKNYETILPFSCCPLVFPWENFNLVWNFQSRPSGFPTNNRSLVGRSLEIFNLACNFQFGQEFYQTYAHVTGNQCLAQIVCGSFFGLKHRKTSMKLPERAFFFLRESRVARNSGDSPLSWIRKILVSVKFLSAILGPEMAAPILWTSGKMRSFCRKTHVHKIPPFRGGGLFWVLEGGSADFIFMGARIFLTGVGHTPSTAGTFRKKFRKNSGKTPEMLSERFLEFPSRVRLGSPKPYNSRHLRLPEHFQNSLPPSTAGDASFFRSGSGKGLSEPVMESPALIFFSLPFWISLLFSFPRNSLLFGAFFRSFPRILGVRQR